MAGRYDSPVPSPHRWFNNSSTELEKNWIYLKMEFQWPAPPRQGSCCTTSTSHSAYVIRKNYKTSEKRLFQSRCANPSERRYHFLCVRQRYYRRWERKLLTSVRHANRQTDSRVYVVFLLLSSSVGDLWHFGYGSGSADPCLWLLDPDPDSYQDPAITVIEPSRHLHHFSKIKSKKKSQNSRNQGLSYYFCLMIEGSWSRRPKNIGIRWIRIRIRISNTAIYDWPCCWWRRWRTFWRSVAGRRSASSCTRPSSGTFPKEEKYSELEFLTFKEPRNRLQGINSASLCSLAADRYDNPIPTRFLAPLIV